MLDTLKTQGEMLAGIPEGATRVTAFIIFGFVIAVLILLLYLKMKEVDQREGI